MYQMDLPQIRLIRISARMKQMLYFMAIVRISFDAQAGNQPDRQHVGFAERVVRIAAHCGDKGSHIVHSGHTVNDQPSLMPTVLMTLLHFSVSSAMSLPKSPGEPGRTGPARSANVALNLGSARPALISVLSLSMISLDVSLGAPTPKIALCSKPGKKSLTVGSSGSSSDRVAVVTARARSRPALIWSMEVDMLSHIICTWPPSKSVSARVVPRYGCGT